MSEDEDPDQLDELVDDLQEVEIGSDEKDSINYDDYNIEDIDGEKENILLSRDWYPIIDVDIWKTKLHSATVGIRQKDQYRAQSRQFTANMDVIGDVTYYKYSPEDLAKPSADRGKPEKVEEYGEVIAINKSFWDDEDETSVIHKMAEKYKSDYKVENLRPLLKRFVLKSFTELKRDKKKKGHAGRWMGTMEESVLMGLTRTFGDREPRPFLYVSVPGYNYRIAVARSFTYVGDRYMFTLPNPDTGELTIFELRGKRGTPGDDFECLLAETEQHVADLDDRKLNIGGKITIRFDNPDEFENLYRSQVLRRVLVQFAAYIHFNNEVNDKYDKIYHALKEKEDYLKKLRKAEKKGDPAKIDAVKQKYLAKQKEVKMLKSIFVGNSELTLHYNPRRIRT